MTFWEFGWTVVDQATDLVPFLTALILASLVRTRLDVALAIINLCLLMELVATITNPDYRYIHLIAPRLLASTLQIIVASYLIAFWSQRQERRHNLAVR